MKEYEHGELARDILKGLAVGGFIVACLALPGLPQVVTLFGGSGARDRYRVAQAVRGLQKKRLVRVYERDGEDVVEITEAGKKKVLAYDLDDMTLKKQKRWDKTWHIVMFDIPESKRKARSALSRKVRELGLYPLQRSVFVSPYPCKDEIDFIGEFYGVRKHLIYIKAQEIESAQKLRKYFGI